jgi:hypothetical protein
MGVSSSQKKETYRNIYFSIYLSFTPTSSLPKNTCIKETANYKGQNTVYNETTFYLKRKVQRKQQDTTNE